METVIMTRADVGEIVVNASDVAEWQGYGFALKATPKKRAKAQEQP